MLPYDLKDPLIVEVGIGELLIAESPKRLLTPALGSCVGVSFYDPWAKRGALCHIMLPTPGFNGEVGKSGRFADFAIKELVRMMADAGSPKRRLEAKMAGGAAMFRGDSTMANIGGRNVVEVKKQLELMHVPLVAEDTGEAYARTIELDLDSGELLVRSYQFGVRRL